MGSGGIRARFSKPKIESIYKDCLKNMKKMVAILKEKSFVREKKENKATAFRFLIVYMFAIFLECIIYDPSTVKIYNTLLDKLEGEKMIISQESIHNIINSFISTAPAIQKDNYQTLYTILFTKLNDPMEKGKLKHIVIRLRELMELYPLYFTDTLLNAIFEHIKTSENIIFHPINKIFEDIPKSGGSYKCRRKNRNVTKKRTRKNRRSLR